MHFIRYVLLAVFAAASLVAVSEASSSNRTKPPGMTSLELPPVRSVVANAEEKRFLRGAKTEKKTNADSSYEERLVIPSSVNSQSNTITDSLFRAMLNVGETPARLAERLKIGKRWTLAIFTRLYKRYAEFYARVTLGKQ